MSVTQQQFALNVEIVDRYTRIEDAVYSMFRWHRDFECWMRPDGTYADPFDVGHACYVHGLQRDEMIGAAMSAGWDDARGYDCYYREMEREQIDAQRRGWQS